jgi:hypothetical protein
MPFIVIVIGIIIAVAAFNDSHGTLFAQLKQDIPGYFKWAVAIAAILGLGFIPGFKVPSRYLIALVALVVILTNAKQVFAGFTQFAGTTGPPTGTGATEPTSAYVQSGGAGGTPSQAQIAGIANSGRGVASAPTAAQNLAANFANPGAIVAGFTASIGFGGVASSGDTGTTGATG